MARLRLLIRSTDDTYTRPVRVLRISGADPVRRYGALGLHYLGPNRSELGRASRVLRPEYERVRREEAPLEGSGNAEPRQGNMGLLRHGDGIDLHERAHRRVCREGNQHQ